MSVRDVPVGAWVLMTNSAGETCLVQRLDEASWHVEGDVTLHTDDLLDVQAWQVLAPDDDGRLPARVEVAEARRAFDRARAEQDWDAAGALLAPLDDLDSVGVAEAGALRDEVAAWLALFGEDR